MNDTEWLEWRRDGITATDVVKLAGLSPYGGPYSVWLDKMGQLPRTADNDRLSFGRWWEAAANRALEEQTGLHVLGEQTWCHHPTDTWARATPDGFIAEHPDTALADCLGVVEHKSFNVLADGGLRADVEAQVQWQMHVTGMTHAWVTGLIGRQFVWRVVERDEADIAWLVTIAETFRDKHILGGEQPAATGADLEALNGLPADAVDEAVELDDETVRTIAALRDAKAEQRALSDRIDALEAAVKQSLGGAVIGTRAGAPLVTWRLQTRTTLDTKRLADEHPDIARAYEKSVETRFFRLTNPKTTKEHTT